MLKFLFQDVMTIWIYFNAFSISMPSSPSNKIPYCQYPINDIEVYQNAIDFISRNQELRNGFEFLAEKKKIGKKFFKDGKYKLKVCDEVYMIDMHANNSLCAYSEVNQLDSNIKLNTLSICPEDYKFMVYFSVSGGQYLECKIVPRYNTAIDENYSIRTRFGRVMKLQFCTENNQIVKYKMSLSTEN